MATSHIRFNNSDEEYQATDSEDELSEHELELLNKARKKPNKYSDSEEEVLGVDNDDDSESDQSDIALSDVEGQEDDDGLPDAKAWGKNKRHYYSTDYVDPDYGGFQGKDAMQAEIEEEEARNLQNELTKNLDDDDFSLEFLGVKKQTTDKVAAPEEVIKTDVSSLSKREQLKLLEKESPEFFNLMEDYKSKMNFVKDKLQQLVDLYRDGKIQNSEASDFILFYHQLILNYCTNIQMYFLLKANRHKMESHPIIKRLYQYRQLLTQMEPVFEEVINPQIDLLLSYIDNKKTINKDAKKKTLKLLSSIIEKSNKTAPEIATKKKANDDLESESKKVKLDEDLPMIADSSNDDEEEEETLENQTEDVGEGNEDGRRPINFQIAKNKGLMPHRKKEQRNPRVKHRNKYRKAKIRRKGAVREVRTEMSRYGGEMSGIKATVTKSIKIK